MKFVRPVVALVATGAAVALAIPSQAAAAKTVYFDTQVGSGTGGCTPTYVLTPGHPSGGACGGFTLGYGGTTVMKATENYVLIHGSVKGKVDASKHITGTIYLEITPPVGLNLGVAGTPNSQGGPVGADISFLLNNAAIGKVSASGLTVPGSPLAVPVNVAIPKKFNKKSLSSLEVDIVFTSGTGVSVVGDSGSQMSDLLLPVH